jgi:hypothetical protein
MTTAKQLLGSLGCTPNGSFRIGLYWWEGPVDVQLKLTSDRRSSWSCVVTRGGKLTSIDGGELVHDGVAVPPLPDLAGFPAWLKRVDRKLGSKLAATRPRIEAGRALLDVVPLLSAWLGHAAPAAPRSLADWVRAPRPKTMSAREARSEAAWVRRQLGHETLPAGELAQVAALIAGDFHGPLFAQALHARTSARFRKALGAALQRDVLVTPLFEHVMGRLLITNWDAGQVADFHQLAASFSHLPGLMKKRDRFVPFVPIAGVARAVAKTWPKIATMDFSLGVGCYAVVLVLALDGTAASKAALAAIVRGQAKAAEQYGDPGRACDDVVDRIVAAVAGA